MRKLNLRRTPDDRGISQNARLAVLVALSTLFLVCSATFAQTADSTIEPRNFVSSRPAVLAKLGVLRTAGKLLSMDQVGAALEKPTPQKVNLPAPADKVLTSSQIAAVARKAMIRVGWYYLCKKCDNWHMNIADGYAITSDGIVATCYHESAPKPDLMRSGYLYAMNTNGDVFPVSAILAADAKLDTVIFRIDATNLTPVALNDQTSIGDKAFLLSDPGGTCGYFSAGLINRFYWDADKPGNDPTTLDNARSLRINFSVEWAPGSSGAAVLDQFGNAIGHVSEIAAQLSPPHTARATTSPTSAATPAEDDASKAPTQRATYLLLHKAVSARGVKLLVESMSGPATNKSN